MGDTGMRALALAEAIERGEPLAQAVRAARLRMGTAMKLAVRLGERLGLLGPAMQQQLDACAADRRRPSATPSAGWFIWRGVTVVMSGVSTFVLLRIVPVFQRMFFEFQIELPAATQLVIDIANWPQLQWAIQGIGSALIFGCGWAGVRLRGLWLDGALVAHRAGGLLAAALLDLDAAHEAAAAGPGGACDVFGLAGRSSGWCC